LKKKQKRGEADSSLPSFFGQASMYFGFFSTVNWFSGILRYWLRKLVEQGFQEYFVPTIAAPMAVPSA
jgi:hypothetical protein